VRDENRVTSELGVSDADGTTPVGVTVDPTTQRLQARIVSLGASATVGTRIVRDDNNVPVKAGASSVDDAPIPLHTTPDGALLINNS